MYVYGRLRKVKADVIVGFETGSQCCQSDYKFL